MTTAEKASTTTRPGRGEIALAAAVVALLLGLSVAAGVSGLWKLMVIALVSFGSMTLGAVLGLHAGTPGRGLTWAHGLAAGAMVASACAFLLPVALRQHPQLGGFGVAGGLLAGFALHALGGRLEERSTMFDDTVLRLTLHAVGAGLVIGAIYTTLPGIGLLLGLSIISHKGPAGYVAGQRLHRGGRSVLPLSVPAALVGIPAVALGLLGVAPVGQLTAVVFGFAAGIFLHVGLEFLPLDRDERGRRLVAHAASSAVLGAGVVVIAWAIVGAATATGGG